MHEDLEQGMPLVDPTPGDLAGPELDRLQRLPRHPRVVPHVARVAGPAFQRVVDEPGAALAPFDASPLSVHVCATFTDGTLKCWGGNIYGGLGLGDKVHRGWKAGHDLPLRAAGALVGGGTPMAHESSQSVLAG